MYYSDMWLKRFRLKVLMSHRAYCAPDWTWDSRHNRWTGYHLWTIAGGRGHLETPQGPFDLRVGDCFVLDTTEVYIGSGDPRRPLVVPAVNFQILDERARIQKLNRHEVPLYRRINGYSFVEEQLDRCVMAHAKGEAEVAEHWLRGALMEIHAQDHGRSRGVEGDELAAEIEHICTEVRNDPGASYRIEDLAKRTHCTPDHFIRVFKRRVGRTPIEFVLRARIDAAKRLLKFSSHSVKRIAELLGYSNQYFFSRQFKKRSGISPSAYRRD